MRDVAKLTRRPIEPADTAGWVTLLDTIRAADGGWQYFTDRDLRPTFGHPYRDYPRGSRAVYDGSVMVGYAVLTGSGEGDPVHRMRYHGGVHPAYRDHGLGAELLAWAEPAAVVLHEERYPGRPMSLSGTYPSSRRATALTYRRRGYQLVRKFMMRSKDFSHDSWPPSPWQIMVRVDPVASDGLAGLRSLHQQTFGQDGRATDFANDSWGHLLDLGAFRPACCFVAHDGAEPQGLAVGHEYDLDATGRRGLYLSILGARPAQFPDNVILPLWREALRSAKEAGLAVATLAVAASPSDDLLERHYINAGFRSLPGQAQYAETQSKALRGPQPAGGPQPFRHPFPD